MKLSLNLRCEVRYDLSFVEVQFDSRSTPHQLRPGGEAGVAKWGRYAGLRWLGLMFLAQWKYSRARLTVAYQTRTSR